MTKQKTEQDEQADSTGAGWPDYISEKHRGPSKSHKRKAPPRQPKKRVTRGRRNEAPRQDTGWNDAVRWFRDRLGGGDG